MNHNTTIVQCPNCGQSVPWNEESFYRPFCSKRCQLIDLGEWAAEQKRIVDDTPTADDSHWHTQE